MAKSKRRTDEIRIKEKDDDYFRKQDDPTILPPELNMSIRDGFRFGIGFILAMLIFYTVVILGVIIFVRFGNFLNF